MLEELVSHKRVATFWVVPRKTDALIHVEGFHVFEGQVSTLIVFSYLLAAAKWGAPGAGALE